MKVFISWSGELSKRVAELLKQWLPDVLQSARCWISTKDIDKGAIWFEELFQKVGELNIGISCVARDNLTAPWLLWELGALSKGLTTSRVCPFLINLEPKELIQPWQQYNATRATQEEMLTLVKTINDSNPKEALEPDRLNAAFGRCWREFDQKFQEIVSRAPQTEPRPFKTEEVLTELLQLSRSIHAASQENRALSSLATKIISGRHSPDPWSSGLLHSPERDTIQQYIDAYRAGAQVETPPAGGYSTPELAKMGAEFQTGIEKNHGLAVAVFAVLSCLPPTAKVDKKRAHEIAELILKDEPKSDGRSSGSFALDAAFNNIESLIGFAENLRG